MPFGIFKFLPKVVSQWYIKKYIPWEYVSPKYQPVVVVQ